MSQNERIVPISNEDFEKYCDTLGNQILDGGVVYDWVIVLLNGARHVWTYLSEVLIYKDSINVKASRYPDGKTQSRQPPEFTNFPKTLRGNVLIIDDCVDDGDTMFEAENRCAAAGASLIHSAVVLCKPANLKIKDWRPTFIGWDNAPGDIFFDFPREAFQKNFQAARAARTASTSKLF